MGVTSFDHVAFPVADADRTLEFYEQLGFDVEGAQEWRAGTGQMYSIRVGATSKINVHPESFVARRGDPSYLRAPTAEPGGADLCFVWEGGLERLVARLDELGVPVISGPGPRNGARARAVSLYCRDPDENLIEFMSYDPDDPLGVLLLHNTVVGCTVAINRALIDVAAPLPRGSAHDWWLALCAASTGVIRSTGTPTVKYRQHSSQAIGARARRGFLVRLAKQPRRFILDSLRAFKVGVDQAAALSKRLATSPARAPSQIRRLDQYSQAFGDGSFFERRRRLRSSGAKPHRQISKWILYGIVAIYPRLAASLREKNPVTPTRSLDRL